MQFYFRQFAADDAVTSMDLDTVGAHILLMCAAGSASHGYKIPADDRAIKTRLRNPSESDFLRIKKQLLAGAWKISPCGEWWIQDGMRRTLLKQKEFSKKQSDKAGKRWAHAKDMPKVCRNDAEPMPSSTSTSTSTSTNIIKRKIDNSVIFPNGLNEPYCKGAWSEWLEHKKSKGQSYKSAKAQSTQLARCANKGLIGNRFVNAINYSIAQNYAGIFEDPTSPQSSIDGQSRKSQGEINMDRSKQAVMEILKECGHDVSGNEPDTFEI